MKGEIALDKLTLYSILLLSKEGKACNYESIVEKCFTAFPERFCMQVNKSWPDGKKIVLSIQRCRDRGWLLGSFREGFRLTPLGERDGKEVKELLKGRKHGSEVKVIVGRVSTADSELVDYMKKTELYKKWERNHSVELNEDEFRSFLQVSYEAAQKVCKERISKYRSAAEFMKDKELLTFLDHLAETFKGLISTWRVK
ncbi:MAG: hypothetical protein QXO75_10330 [Nitrososphaerota archaeon]